MIVRIVASGIVIAVAIVTVSTALAACGRPIGAVSSVQGEAQVQDATGFFRRAALDDPLCPGDVIHVADRSRAAISITGQPNVRLNEKTGLYIPGDDQPLLVRLLYGAAYFFSRHPRTLTINTPFVDAAVEGTEFLVKVEAERTLIIVFAGRVRASNPQGELTVGDGQSVIAEAGQAPTPYLVARPQDAVQWTLFYPSILPALADPSGAAAQALPEPLQGAVALAATGQLPAAFARFEAIPESDRDADYYLYRAATLLSVGRVEEAGADIAQALIRDPSDGRADALSAVIAVAQNDRERALEEARRAVELSPRSAAAQIALSYALQARFDIQAAREALQQAVKDEPENPLAWARLSELWLMQGRRGRAREAAKKARELAPELARTQTVLGFAELAEINTGRAKKAFRRAIEIDSANPLPRFGLGLATIRAGDLEAGRKQIEIAVALDPENALLRSYLGKAYFDERTTNPLTYFRDFVDNFPNQENTLAAQQFAISKELDPNDPTPWLYDAIRLQSENRPVEALRNIEKSIELNDNRAVYRSRELLDQDRAARGTSLARIYNDLGFQQLGINEATKSLSYDPANAGAHRLLADIYQPLQLRESARLSELLQAQLLQDININPVQPSLSETNLNIITGGGPVRPGFNEYTPLFERNQAQLNLSGVVGSDWTRGEEAVVSGIYDNVSVSAGQFLYKNNGFRDNFDMRHDVYDFFAQAAPTPKLNVQAEVRSRHTEEGNLLLNFNPRETNGPFERDLDVRTQRVGMRLTPSPNSNFLTSLIHVDRHDKFSDVRRKDDGLSGETGFFYNHHRFSSLLGAGAYTVDRRTKNSNPILELFQNNFKYTSIDQQQAFFYNYIQFPSELLWTLGMTLENYDQAELQYTKFNPRLGLQWSVTDSLIFRIMAARIIARPPALPQTLVPTQVAGFNIVYDDFTGTEATLYGIGADWYPLSSVALGFDIIGRNLSEPVVISNGEVNRADRHETRYRSYLYLAPSLRWTLGAEIQYDIYNGNPRGNDRTLPNEVNTFSIPITARYFDPSGFFGAFTATTIHQNVNDESGASVKFDGDDAFVVVDLSAGYRLPQRRGSISIGVNNVLGENFKFRDNNFRVPTDAGEERSISPYLPERTIFATITLNL